MCSEQGDCLDMLEATVAVGPNQTQGACSRRWICLVDGETSEGRLQRQKAKTSGRSWLGIQ